MNRLTLILILTMTVLLGSSGVSWGADFQKGLDAYERGDYATALKEFTPLAEPGYALAQYNLGVGYALAQFNLGAMYDKGRGVPQDYQTAVKWYTLAAEKGYAPAQYNLGVMYGMGQGVPEDYKTAVKWFALAAEQGYAPAQFDLGVMYAKGDGVIKDNVYAHMWGNISASNGNEKGGVLQDLVAAIAVSIGGKGKGKVRDFVAKQMTPAQIEKAQELARECVKKNYKNC